MKVYVVAIKLKNGGTLYVSLEGGALRPSLVKVRSRATTYTNRRVADIVSDYFWQNHWDRNEHDTREVEQFKVRSL